MTYSAEGLKDVPSLRIHPNGDGTNGLDDIETITLEVRPAWREVAALRGKSVKWMVNQSVGLTCSNVIRRAKAKAEREAKHGNTK